MKTKGAFVKVMLLNEDVKHLLFKPNLNKTNNGMDDKDKTPSLISNVLILSQENTKNHPHMHYG
jgi:hypothetical protein